MFRELLSIVVNLVQAGIPLPNFQDRAEVLDWIHRDEGPIADLVVFVAQQIKTPLVLEAGDQTEAVAAAAEAAKIDIATVWQIIKAVLALIEMLRK